MPNFIYLLLQYHEGVLSTSWYTSMEVRRTPDEITNQALWMKENVRALPTIIDILLGLAFLFMLPPCHFLLYSSNTQFHLDDVSRHETINHLKQHENIPSNEGGDNTLWMFQIEVKWKMGFRG